MAECVFWACDAKLKRWKTWLDAPGAPARAVGLKVWRPGVGIHFASAAGGRRGLPRRVAGSLSCCLLRRGMAGPP